VETGPEEDPARPPPARRVAVVAVGDEYGLVALEPLAAGEVLLAIEGLRVVRPTRTSLQVGEADHVDAPAGLDHATLARDHPWVFLNHSCRPNTRIRGLEVVALRRVQPGEAVTFDYETTEYEVACPFPCRCGSDGCAGWIRGFRHLAAAAQARRLPLLAPHLRRRLAAPATPAATGAARTPPPGRDTRRSSPPSPRDP
jgi:hypothetical protein